MDNFAKNQAKKRDYTRVIIVVLVPIFLLLTYSVISVYGKSRSVTRKDNEAQVVLSDLEARQKQIENDIAYLQTNSGVEEVLRDKYRAVKEGEEVVVIVDEKESAEKVVSEEKGFWEMIKNIFR